MELALKFGFFQDKSEKCEGNLEAKKIGEAPNINFILPKHIISQTLTLD